LAPGYVANNVEFHANIVSEGAGVVNANKSSNEEVERRGVAVTPNEDTLYQSSTLPPWLTKDTAPRSLEPLVSSPCATPILRAKFRAPASQ
jgi:hypothetical protein